MSAQTCIEIIAVAHLRYGELRVFVQSILNQTAGNWRLQVIHDGPDESFDRIMAAYQAEAPERIRYSHTGTRHNDYGHSLREIGLARAEGDYVLITNADNYYIPRFVEYCTKAVSDTGADIIMYDMVHSHENPGQRTLPAYSYFQTQYSINNIDMGAAIVRRTIAQQAGFADKSYAADAVYFEKVALVKREKTTLCKINRVMLVHN
ncbi:glycosyltransferase family A protein [Uliginosibacterium paludis]|uniref:Glycosyltransferase family A protein n=1 Tax=Uliginosibacterium paludis TaxID=1615952 RepID=A0ABV2CN55_9RHOO